MEDEVEEEKKSVSESASDEEDNHDQLCSLSRASRLIRPPDDIMMKAVLRAMPVLQCASYAMLESLQFRKPWYSGLIVTSVESGLTHTVPLGPTQQHATLCVLYVLCKVKLFIFLVLFTLICTMFLLSG